MLSCDVTTDLMAAYESGEASAETRRLVEEHLSHCPSCRSAFGKGARVESALRESKRDDRPANGQSFVSRTRRYFFFVGIGALLFFSVHAAVVMRVFTKTIAEGVAGAPLGFAPLSPGLARLSGLALAVTAGTALVYTVLVLRSAAQPRGSRSKDVAKAIVGGVLLTALALTAFYLWVAGPFLPAALASILLLAALSITATRLSRLPYFTIAAICALLVAIAVLLNGMLLVRMTGRF